MQKSSTSIALSPKPSITLDLDIHVDSNDVSMSSDADVEQPTGEIFNLLQDIEQSQPLDVPESDQEQINEAQNPLESESESSLIGGDSDMENHYEIQIEPESHHLLECTPCTQYECDVDLECDVTSGWVRLEQDTVHLCYMIFRVHVKHTLI